MPSRYRRPVTAEEKEAREQAHTEKLAALHDRLAEQVQSLRTGEDWQRWLDVAGRFTTYSFHNTLLIYAQRPDATAVAGYEAWKTLGRQVDKGEKGIQILAPIVRRRRAGEPAEAGSSENGAEAGRGATTAAPSGAETLTEEKPDRESTGRVAGFRVTYVWDVAQTSGEPLPTPPRPQLLSGQAPPGLWDSLTQLLTGRGFTVERGDCGPANGWTDYQAGTVRVRGDVDEAQAVKTLAHEAGHVLLHTPTSTPSTTVSTADVTTAHCRGVKEVEAESVAYLVAAAHGLDTGGYAFAYVTGWAAGVDGTEPEQVVRDTGQRVLTAARTVLAATTSETTPLADADSALAARAQAGAERTAAARKHEETTQVLAGPPAATAVQLEVLARLHADAAAFYTAQLHAGTEDAARAGAMLEGRGVPPAAVDGYQLGYAPPGWTALTDHLRGCGWTDQQLLAAGVGMATRRGGVVDRFRDRIIFPVHDPSGERVIAFIGRALTVTEGAPKYLNSPETALYRKGEVLYGLGAAPTRHALAAGAKPVLVEGALDAIAVTAAGDGRYVGVAPSGTALTSAQVAGLNSSAGPLAQRGVTVAFDSDPAGRQAALRAYPLLRAAGAWPAAATLPAGQDPAGLIQHSRPGALTAALDAATPLANLVVDERLDRWTDRLQWVEGKVGAARDAAQLVATFPPEHIGPQVLRVADRLDLDPAGITAEVTDAISRGAGLPRRLARRDRRQDLDRCQAVTTPGSAAQLARGGFPAWMRSAAWTSSTDPMGVRSRAVSASSLWRSARQRAW